MQHLNICTHCSNDGILVECDGCSRAYHKKCFGGIDETKDFFCGKCHEPISKALLEKNTEYTDISRQCEDIKRAAKKDYMEYHDMYRWGTKTTSRNASSNKKNRSQLLAGQINICAGLLMGNNHYRRCNNRATECDHIIELRYGGTDEVENCQMLCSSCHHDKTAGNYYRQSRY